MAARSRRTSCLTTAELGRPSSSAERADVEFVAASRHPRVGLCSLLSTDMSYSFSTNAALRIDTRRQKPRLVRPRTGICPAPIIEGTRRRFLVGGVDADSVSLMKFGGFAACQALRLATWSSTRPSVDAQDRGRSVGQPCGHPPISIRTYSWSPMKATSVGPKTAAPESTVLGRFAHRLRRAVGQHSGHSTAPAGEVRAENIEVSRAANLVSRRLIAPQCQPLPRRGGRRRTERSGRGVGEARRGRSSRSAAAAGLLPAAPRVRVKGAGAAQASA